MFLNPKSWEKWIHYFEQRDYHCIAPAWPFHEGEPSSLRRNIPRGVGNLALETVIDEFARIASSQNEPPIAIGHSMGGLIAQVLENRGLLEAAVCCLLMAIMAL